MDPRHACILRALDAAKNRNGWVMHDVLSRAVDEPELELLLTEMIASGEIVEQVQTWSRLDQNFEKIGTPVRVRMLRRAS